MLTHIKKKAVSFTAHGLHQPTALDTLEALHKHSALICHKMLHSTVGEGAERMTGYQQGW